MGKRGWFLDDTSSDWSGTYPRVDIRDFGGGQDKTAAQNTQAFADARAYTSTPQGAGKSGTIYFPYDQSLGATHPAYEIEADQLNFTGRRVEGDYAHSTEHTALKVVTTGAWGVSAISGPCCIRNLVVSGNNNVQYAIRLLVAHKSLAYNVGAVGATVAAWSLQECTSCLLEAVTGGGSTRAFLFKFCTNTQAIRLSAQAKADEYAGGLIEVWGHKHNPDCVADAEAGGLYLDGVLTQPPPSGATNQPNIWLRGVGGGSVRDFNLEGNRGGILVSDDSYNLRLDNGRCTGGDVAYRVDQCRNIHLVDCHADGTTNYERILWIGSDASKYKPTVDHCRKFSSNSNAALSVEQDGTESLGIPNARLWLLANTLTNGAVQTWPDQSGFGNDATQVTSGNQPVKEDTFNGTRPGVKFDGVNDYLSANGVAIVGSALPDGNPGPWTLVTAVQLQSTTSGTPKSFASFGKSSSSNNFHRCYVPNAGTYKVERKDATSPAKSKAGGSVDTSAHIVTWKFDGQDVSIYVDGVAVVNSQNLATGTISFDLFTIAAFGTSSVTDHIDMKLAELVLFPWSLSDEDRYSVESRVGTRQGITIPEPCPPPPP